MNDFKFVCSAGFVDGKRNEHDEYMYFCAVDALLDSTEITGSNMMRNNTRINDGIVQHVFDDTLYGQRIIDDVSQRAMTMCVKILEDGFQIPSKKDDVPPLRINPVAIFYFKHESEDSDARIVISSGENSPLMVTLQTFEGGVGMPGKITLVKSAAYIKDAFAKYLNGTSGNTD